MDRLLKLRLIVARYGEMDLMGWWNTHGVLGPRGQSVYQRGFLRTHSFAQARVVFSVACDRCDKLVGTEGLFNLFHLPPAIEDQFELEWQKWVRDASAWSEFIDAVASMKAVSLLEILDDLAELSPNVRSYIGDLSRHLSGNTLLLPSTQSSSRQDLTEHLAASFSLGSRDNLVVPCIRLDEMSHEF